MTGRTLERDGFEIIGADAYITPDERDADMIAERLAAFGPAGDIVVGDFVEYPDGELRRVSHVWRDESGAAFSVQTSVCGASGQVGSFHLGTGSLSYSGSLERGIRPEYFRPTGRVRAGACWVFHHGTARAHRAVHLLAARRVWEYVGSVES